MIDWRAHVRRRLPALDLPPEREIEIVDELALQLEAAYDAARGAGLDEPDARRAAEGEVPDWRAFAVAVVRSERPAAAAPPAVYPSQPAATDGGIMRGIARDLASAARALVRTPGYTALATLTGSVALALGAAAFSLINGVLLKPLPFADADRLVVFHATVPPEGRETIELAYLDADDLGAETAAFDRLTIVAPFAGTTTIVDPPVRIEGLAVSPAFFDVFAVRATLGRTFTADDARPSSAPVAVIGHGFWARLGSPVDVIGRTIALDEVPRTIVGVGPPAFRFDLLALANDVFVPLTPDHPLAASRAIRTFRTVARLRDGVTVNGASAIAAAVGSRLQAAYPDTNEGRTFSVHPLQAEIVGPSQPVLWFVAALVALVIVVAGVNLASLLLARSVARSRETMIRLALGASRWRLARESLSEGVVIGAVGCAVGVPAAKALIDGLRVAPGLALPRLADVDMDMRACAVLLGLAALVVGLAALMPIGVVRRLNPLSAVRTGHETADRFTARTRSALVSAQVALAFLLLLAAALLASSLYRVLQQPLGFETDRVMTMRMSVPAARYPTRDATAAFYTELLDALRARASVSAAGIVSTLPLAGNTGSTLTVYGREEVPLPMRPTIGWQWASPVYFAAMGMPIVRGRAFTELDVARTPHVSIINETLARLYFAGVDPIGQRIYCGGYTGNAPPEWHEIIGVVGDVRHRGLEAAPDPRVYDLFGQHWGRAVTLVVRTPDSSLQAAGLVRSLLAERDPQLAVFSVRTMSAVVASAVATRRLLAWLVAGFSVVGLLLVLVGLYGTVSYMVACRTRELGVRLALGATRGDIRRLVLQYGLRIVAAGVAAGGLGALVLRRTVDQQLYGVTGADPAVMIGTAIGVIVVSLLACVVPAERAIDADPAQTLRQN